MRIVESFLRAKAGEIELCEDAFVVTSDFACVVDGVTSKSDKNIEGMRAGAFVSRLIVEIVKELRPNMECKEALRFITKRMIEKYKEKGLYEILTDDLLLQPAACMVIYSKARNEIWMVGDCQALVDGQLYTNEKKVDETIAEMRSYWLEGEIISGKTIEELIEQDTSRDVLKPFFEKQICFQNSGFESDYSYEALAGFKEVSKFKLVKFDALPSYVVLASDGFPILRPTLEETLEELEKIKREDPLMFRIHKSTKGVKKGANSFDDCCYLKLCQGTVL